MVFSKQYDIIHSVDTEERQVLMGSKVTFDDIAAYTHFSKTTISRYFNNPESVTLQNRKIISDALEALNYKNNKVARILANSKSEFIGIIIPHFEHQFYSSIVQHLIDTYTTYGYKFIIFLGKEDPDKERKYIRELLSYKIEGLIELSHNLPSEELKEIGIPVVSIEREDQYISSVNTDNFYGGRLAAEQFIRDNCDVLIHVNTKDHEMAPGYQRIRGFIDLCESHHSNYKIYQEDFPHSYDKLYQKIETIYDNIEKDYKGQKKGIFWSSDTYASIFINILLKHGKSIPDEYEIIGFDNAPVSRESYLPFSTVSQDAKALAENCIRIIQHQINASKSNSRRQIEHIVIEPSLILRSTTGQKA